LKLSLRTFLTNIGKMTEKDKSLMDFVHFPIIFDMVSLFSIGISFVIS